MLFDRRLVTANRKAVVPRDRKYATLPRGGLYKVQAEAIGRHFILGLFSGVTVEVQRKQWWKNWIVITLRLQANGSGRQPASRQVKRAVISVHTFVK